jgi:protein-L-isoaspartate(D-aspartate) O-methyltransferase
MTDRFWAERQRMVEQQIRRRGLDDARLLGALSEVPRHLFVPLATREAAYDDTPLAIGHGQTISQPYIVALMTSALELRGREVMLEIGTGSGYQSAILSRLTGVVHTVELIPALAERAAKLLSRLGCQNTTVHVGDGSLGWPDAAPYDAVIVTAAALCPR